MSDFSRFAIAALVVYRITFLVTQEQGPFNIFARLQNLNKNNIIGEILSSFYCFSVWASFACAAVLVWRGDEWSWFDWLVLSVALSGAVVIAFEVSNNRPQVTGISVSNGSFVDMKAVSTQGSGGTVAIAGEGDDDGDGDRSD